MSPGADMRFLKNGLVITGDMINGDWFFGVTFPEIIRGGNTLEKT